MKISAGAADSMFVSAQCDAGATDSVFVSAQCMKCGAGATGAMILNAQLREMRCRGSGFNVCECSVA